MDCIDRKQWLTDHKLEDAIGIFESRNVEIEELLDFDEADLKAFANNVLQLDVLARNRFLKAIHALQKQNNNTPTKPDTSTNTPNAVDFNFNFMSNTQSQAIIVSPQENQAKEHLYQRNDEIATLCYTITVSIDQLEQSHLNVLAQIDDTFNALNTHITLRKDALLSERNHIEKQKTTALSQQLSSTEHYLPILKDTKDKYYKCIEDRNMDLRSRKKKLLKLVSHALNQHQGAIKLPSTAPNIRFTIPQKALAHFIDLMHINNCDQPRPPLLTIKKRTATSVTVQWTFHAHYRANTIDIECALIPKSVHINTLKMDMVCKHKWESNDTEKTPIRSFLSSMFTFGSNKQNDGDVDTDSEMHDETSAIYSNDPSTDSTHSSGYDTDADVDTDQYKERKKKRKQKKCDQHHQTHSLTLELPNDFDTDRLEWKTVHVKKKKKDREITDLRLDGFYAGVSREG